MNANLDNIAKELYGKIQTRFPSIKIGDEEANVLSKKQDIPKARFFEFEYEEHGKELGTITMTLDEEDGLLIQFSGDLIDEKTNSTHRGAYRFIRSFRQFAKDRLLNFDASNIGKSNLDKRDYKFLAKSGESTMMESKLFGTNKVSYQDLGEAKLIIKHTESVNLDLPAGRTMHIGSIYIENALGERFLYPTKHLNGARALAEHIKAGGTPYDALGLHVIGLSEELASLRKFKGYVTRNEALSEAMGDITSKVMERIDQIKETIHKLQRPAYYKEFAESFEASEEQMIPEEIMNDWVDRLTIRTFNEDMKAVFPYLYNLVSESDLPVIEMSADDLLDEEKFDPLKHVKNPTKGEKDAAKDVKRGSYADRAAMLKSAEADGRLKKEDRLPEEIELEEFFNSLVGEEDENGASGTDESNTLFSDDEVVQNDAVNKINDLFQKPIPAGSGGQAGILALKGLIDDPMFVQLMQKVESGLDTRAVVSVFLAQKDQENGSDLADRINFDGEGEDSTQTPPAEVPAEPVAPEAPAEVPAEPVAPEETAPPAEEPPAPAPVAETNRIRALAGLEVLESDEPPFDGPYKKASGDVTDKSGAKHGAHSQAKHLAHQGLKAAIAKAKQAGAKLDTPMVVGGRHVTLHDAIEECGMTPMECGFDMMETMDGQQQIMQSIQGFWNEQEKNFTKGGTGVKVDIIKNFKNGEYPNATPEDVKAIFAKIDAVDPSHAEQDAVLKLAGVRGQEQGVDEEGSDTEFPDFDSEFQHDLGNADAMHSTDSEENNTVATNNQTGTIDGQPADYDDAMAKFRDIVKGMKFKMPGSDQDFDFEHPDKMGSQIQNHVGGMMKGIADKAHSQPAQMPAGQMNPNDMMKQIMSKINFGN